MQAKGVASTTGRFSTLTRVARASREDRELSPIVDASALLAVLNDEPGSEVVAALLPMAALSTVNLSEVVAKLVEKGMPTSLLVSLDLDLEASAAGSGQKQRFRPVAAMRHQ